MFMRGFDGGLVTFWALHSFIPNCCMSEPSLVLYTTSRRIALLILDTVISLSSNSEDPDRVILMPPLVANNARLCLVSSPPHTDLVLSV